jgi:hypothetical protein
MIKIKRLHPTKQDYWKKEVVRESSHAFLKYKHLEGK